MSLVKKVLSSFQAKIANEQKITEFLKKNSNPKDAQIHALAEELGIDKHKFEEKIYSMLGKCIKKASDKGFVTNIEKGTRGNSNFRKVLYTGKNSQLVLMALKPNEDIGSEVHKDIDQFFRIDEGSGKVVINGTEHDVENGSAFIIPQGSEHNIIAGDKGMKLYSIYSPPHHEDGTIHKTKEIAEKSKEEFNGKTTE